MHGALFVADQKMPDLVLQNDLVVDGKHCSTGITEHGIHALVREGLNNHAGT